MKPQSSHIWVLICLLLSVHFSSSHVLGPFRRQDDSTPSPTASPTPTPSDASRISDEPSSTSRSARPSTIDSDATSSIVLSSAPRPTEDVDTEDGIALNTTIPAGQLPIQPQVTPGWGVAGVLMICTGAVYTVIGIKNDRLHAFFSTAYLTSLGTAVLIMYIMVPPTPLAIQGAYVVAVTLTGVALGAIAMFFKDMTESLGCMLGGFCLSMWLLCLRPGGLLAPGSSAKVILISCFTVVTFGLYFSRWTRDYALILAISFSGATVTVLGIDCFSRAGLKEFWAYLWNLNENLFPLGTHTYPLTRGIEVELAAIVILALAGVISQLKLWRIVKDRRTKKAAERAEGQRNLEEEEEVVGRQVEAENARDRRVWERTYGNGDSQSSTGSNDSGYANGTDYEKARDSASNGKKSRPVSTVQVQVIEMDEMASPDQAPQVPPKQPGAVMMRTDQQGMVTVRVAHDDTLPAPVDGSTRDPDEMTEKTAAAHAQVTPGPLTSRPPEVVPLPFTVPAESHRDLRDADERSSVATYADEKAQAHPRTHQRQSLVRRLSQMSVDKLKRMSHRDSKTIQVGNASQEELVIPRTRHDADNGSIAATMDLDSIDGDMRSIAGASRRSIELNAELDGADTTKTDQPDKGIKHMSAADTVTTGILDPPMDEKQVQPGSNEAVMDTPAEDVSVKEGLAEASHKTKSVLSAGSVPASLSQAHLPEALSRVALSYRTNEWAKHLGNAEMPEPETLQLNEYPEDDPTSQVRSEAAAPVDMAELQQTAETGSPAPHLPRNTNAMGHPLSRSNSQLSVAVSQYGSPAVGAVATLPSQTQTTTSRQTSTTGIRRSSTNLHIQPITEETASRSATMQSRSPSSAAGSVTGASIAERPPVPGVLSYASPQTLIGQRDMYLRNKSNPTLPASMTMPDLYNSPRAPSETGSMYNYPAYGSGALPASPDVDDLPLSQRKEMMRRNSMLQSSTSLGSRPVSGAMYPSGAMTSSAETLAFDSHQPQRHSNLPSQAARDSQLAAFRQSVQADIRTSAPLVPSGPRARDSFYATPFGSSTGLDREAEIQRSIDAQRAMLMGQKEAAAQRIEMNRQEKERHDRAFASMMQSGQWNDAHRDMLRRMQSSANVRDSVTR